MSLALERLPPWKVFRARFRAREEQLLGALPSNAMRGALGHVALDLGGGIDALLQGAPGSGLESGTDGGLSAIPLSGPYLPESARLLPQDGLLELRFALIGEAALAARAPLTRALRRAGERGIGVVPGRRDARPILELEDVEELRPPPLPEAAHYTLICETPFRVRIRGQELVAPGPGIIWEQALRRADALARTFGDGELCPRRIDEPPALHAVWTEHREVVVSRVSGRQKKKMTWRGTMGRIRVQTIDITATSRLLELVRDLGFGKGVSMGCGQISVVASETPSIERE